MDDITETVILWLREHHEIFVEYDDGEWWVNSKVHGDMFTMGSFGDKNEAFEYALQQTLF